MDRTRVAVWTGVSAALGTVLAFFSPLVPVVPAPLGPVIGISITLFAGGMSARRLPARSAAVKGGAFVGGVGTLIATSAGVAMGGSPMTVLVASTIGTISGAAGAFAAQRSRLNDSSSDPDKLQQ